MDRERFEWPVARAVDGLPEEFGTKLENIDVVVEDWPTLAQLAKVGLRRSETLLGLYEGVPLKRLPYYLTRGEGEYSNLFSSGLKN